MIIHSSLSEMKSKIVPTCLQGCYGDSLGEFSSKSYGLFEAERAKLFSAGGQMGILPES